jgi:DNA-binding MarR family transcriptional regulator
VAAGELADESGLSPGAITTVLDRLERGGFANRVADPADRRRVLVVSTVATREIGARVYGEVELAGRTELEQRSGAQLTVIRDYLRRTRGVYEGQIAALTAEVPAGGGAGVVAGGGDGLAPGAVGAPGAGGSPTSAPLAGVSTGRLEYTKGAARLTLRSDRALQELYHAAFEGPAPEIRVDGGSVTVQQRRRFRPFDWRSVAATFSLAGAVPWEIVLRGGMWKLDADLRELRLIALTVSGGASDIEVRLPAPEGTVPVRISGGASKITLLRPTGSDVRAEVAGGASQLVFDDQRLGAVGGRQVLSTPGFAAAVDRYEIRFTGGASQVTIAAL